MGPQYHQMPLQEDEYLSFQNSIPRQEHDDDVDAPQYRSRTEMKHSRWKFIGWQILFHLPPIAVTITIFYLNASRTRWRSFGAQPDTNNLLTAFQVAAKAHEILIVYSASRILLFWLTRWIRKDEGIPFGLFASAYHVAVGGTPLLKGVWRPLRLAFRNIRFLRLLALVLLATVLALTSGPASAIALIPRLGWWHDGGLFTFEDAIGKTSSNAISIYIPANIAPRHVTPDLIPGSFCTESILDRNGSCPYAGFKDILNTINDARLVNTTVGTDIALGQRFLRQDGLGSDQEGVTVASIWTSPRVLSDYMSYGFDQVVDIGGVYTVEAKIGPSRSDPLSSAVDVVCDAPQYPSTNYTRDLTDSLWFTNSLYNANEIFWDSLYPNGRSSFKVNLRDCFNESLLANATVPSLQLLDRVFGDVNILTAVILIPMDNGTSEPLAQICAVNAKQIPTSIYFLSTQAPTVSSNFTWTLRTSPGGYLSASGSPPDSGFTIRTINITKSWATILDTPISSTNTTGMLANLIYQAGLSTPADLNNNDTLHRNAVGRRQGIALASAFSTALSRIASQYSVAVPAGSNENSRYYGFNKTIVLCNEHTRWCGKGHFEYTGNLPAILNGTHNQFLDKYAAGDLSQRQYLDEQLPIAANGDPDAQILEGFLKPANVDEEWTKLDLRVMRYEYGWRFGTATSVGVAVLALHVLLVLVHIICALAVGGNEESESVVGLVNVLGMAWKSTPPELIGASKALDGTDDAEKMANGLVRRILSGSEDQRLEEQSITLRKRSKQHLDALEAQPESRGMEFALAQ